jgi:hypothetical protein
MAVGGGRLDSAVQLSWDSPCSERCYVGRDYRKVEWQRYKKAACKKYIYI